MKRYKRSIPLAALPAERRVLARRGWAGEKSGLFEHPVADITKKEREALLVKYDG